MSASTNVTDLEDVFAKASMPVQASSSQSDNQEKPVIEKSSANDVLADFQIENALLTAAEEASKAIQVNPPSVLSGTVELVEEIQEVLIDAASTLTESSVLASVEESTKTIQETASTTVAGSVELAEEIMEAFANSKTVLDTENPVSTDSCNLQEELDRLEQLAVERVREIEGELVNSSKEITECNLSLDVPKELKTNEMSDNLQKEYVPETVCSSEMVINCEADGSSKQVDENHGAEINTDLTSPLEAVSEVPDVRSEDVVVEKETTKISSDVGNSEPTKESLLMQENSALETTQCVKPLDSTSQGEDQTSGTRLELHVKKDKQQKSSEKDNNDDLQATDGVSGECNGKAEKEEANKEPIGQNEGNKNVDDIELVQEATERKQCLADKLSSEDQIDNVKSNDSHKKPILDTDETTTSIVEGTNEENKIKDIQNYETEDDDLEVLEAFINKTATNPELAVCAVQTSNDDSTLKYSLESALLDDLTKTDNGSITNEENINYTVKENSMPTEPSSDSVTPQKRLSQALEKASQKIPAGSSSSDVNPKNSGNGTSRRPGKQRNSVSTGKDLPLKKRLSETSRDEKSKAGDIINRNSLVKGNNSSPEKKVVTVEVKRRRGRSLISSIKPLSEKSNVTPRDKVSVDKTTSVKCVSGKETDRENNEKYEDNLVSRKSLRNPKTIKYSEENKPSTSGIVLDKKIKEQSSQQSESLKSQKKQSELNIENLPSTSKTTIKIKEGKVEDRSSSTVGSVDATTKERKKSKDVVKSNAHVKANIEDKLACSTSVQETVTDKRNVDDSSSTAKTSKKEEKKVKENVGTRIHKDVKDGSVNTGNIPSSRSTRSTKQVETKKILLSPKHNEQKREKDKENVEKSTHALSDNRDVKRKIEGHTQSPSRTLKKNKVDKRQEEKDRSSLSEGTKNVKRKTDENMQVSNTTVKRSRLEREVEKNTQITMATVKQRAEKDIEENLLNPTTLKRKRTEREFAKSLPNLQITPTALQLNRMEKEFQQSVPNIEMQIGSKSSKEASNTITDQQRISGIYSQNLFFEFEDITFEMLRDKAKQLVLPTPLWGAQVCTEKDLVAFSRMCADLSEDKPLIDKALVFQGSLKPVALINNEPIDLPIPCVRTFEDVVVLIRNFHTVSFCEGTGVKQRPQSKYCFRYLDVANPGSRCSQCLEERRRVLFACARKLRERLRLMRAARDHQ